MPDDLPERASESTAVDTAWGEHAAWTDAERAFLRRLTGTPTGSPLVAVLEGLEADGLDALGGFERVEVVAAAARLEAWAHALKARAAAALDRHESMRAPVGRIPAGAAFVSRNITAATLAMRLQCSPREADTLVREGVSYGQALAGTGEALAAGTIDAPRARALVTRLWDQMPHVAAHVEEEVLPRAGGRTSFQVRQDVERALSTVDPEGAADRHRVAQQGRCVGRPQVRADGMAALWVLLPAVRAVQVDTVLEAAARTARSAGDPRTLEQLRADGLCDLVLGGPGEPAAAAAPALSTVLPTQRSGADGLPPEATATASPARGRAPRTHVLVTVPLSTLIGVEDQPAELAGYGPIDAVQARALAWGGTWQRLVTDPLSGTVLDVGRTRYRPPAALDEHVRYRDRTCTAPGCTVPAERADLDHTVEYHPGADDDPARPLGATSADNLGPACRHHHRLKTETAFTLAQVEPGLFAWTDPTGHTYLVRPGTDDPVHHLTPTTDTDGPPPY
ncbi:HNH endonuclease signature motif containing protein [Cellulomonas hominis]|uniref:HNH endonuclease signature motif containing protein n=1 Tax=Cellulomonas hominis TaxID=156981 RepID=UPI001B9145EC|nr:HNH endonuclease signature motif containing protein [Cellulomonas hominis]VTR77668.1 hypothetical protein CHMI_02440 [Cellulomonas hominis]